MAYEITDYLIILALVVLAVILIATIGLNLTGKGFGATFDLLRFAK